MKKVVFIFFIFISFSLVITASELSLDEQTEIIKNYMYVTGQAERTQLSLSDDIHELPVKCGTPAVVNFMNNYDKLDQSLLKSSGVQVVQRPDFLTDTLDSPSGIFRLYYTTTGDDAIYNGISSYIDSVAAIFDQVYYHIIDTLGYPTPPTDGFYPTGGDDKYDIYIYDIPGSVYGLTYTDSTHLGVLGNKATSFMELENDFQEIQAYVVTDDPYRPLDAVRVTAAHEFFHFVHFGIDFTETEQNLSGVNGPAWMEMSATWMEEEIFDLVNDYYYYLPFFFDSPNMSIQQFKSGIDLHPYGAAVYPIYLSEKFNRDIIREIWLRCGSFGLGPSMLTAAEVVIDSISGSTEDFITTFSEFALWNYFTGSRAYLAPSGVGYSEKDFYAYEFSDSPLDNDMTVLTYYRDTILVRGDQNSLSPPHNAAFYLKLDELRTIKYDTTFINGTPTDIDSVLSIRFILDETLGNHWGVGVIYQFEDNIDSVETERIFVLPQPNQFIAFDIPDPRQYRSITFSITPASSDYFKYNPNNEYFVAYWIPGKSTTIDSTLINIPSAILHPYPNPAVLNKMTESKIRFKFQVPIDSTSYPTIGTIYSGAEPYLLIDIYTIAGEHICTLDEITESDSRKGIYITEWNFKNNSQADIASGVYVAYARFYTQKNRGILLAETKTKVAVIR